MNQFRQGWILALCIGSTWGICGSIVITALLALISGEAVIPKLIASACTGVLVAVLFLLMKKHFSSVKQFILLSVICLFSLVFISMNQPFGVAFNLNMGIQWIVLWSLVLFIVIPLMKILRDTPLGSLNRHGFENTMIRALFGFGYLFFIVIVAVPFYVMVMTSLKSQQSLLANPLDFSLDIEKGMSLFRSYFELFEQFHFGRYLITSFVVSSATVIITLIVSILGAYAVARLRFRGKKMLSRSILLIYLVPMIVLALPIYIAFSMLGLRNSLLGILLIYPVTTIPVALYMLQGYFRGIPAEIEEAGLMDGLNRIQVIIKITLPLSLPAIASVSLYVFMIAWNEFLLAFMLLDDPNKFTLTRGVAMLNSSEIPRQHLMAGSVIATIPILMIFLVLERFMVRGLTSGSVK